jgi:type IX secretion system PorP/SprF family membrane protein
MRDYKGILLALLISLILVSHSHAQTYPLYTLYNSNLFLYNPAAIGLEDELKIGANYKQYWSGIEDAPSIATFYLHFPLKDNFSIGVNINTDKSVLLRTSRALISGAYSVNFNKNHFLKFGLSLGVGINQFEFSNIDFSEDPALINASENTAYLNGQFGIFYRYKKFTFGGSLLQLFDHYTIDTLSFQSINTNALHDYAIFGSYSFSVNQDIEIEPFMLIRRVEDLLDYQQLETGLKFEYKNTFYISTMYRNDYGFIVGIGIKFSPKFNFNYNYEFGNGQSNRLGNGGHEFSIEYTKNLDQDYKMSKNESTEEFVVKKVENKILNPKESSYANKIDSQAVNKDNKEEQLENTQSVFENENNYNDTLRMYKGVEIMPPGIYVVIGVFSIKSNANNFIDNLGIKGKNAIKIMYNEEKKYFYITLSSQNNYNIARNKAIQLRNVKGLEKTWVFKYKVN